MDPEFEARESIEPSGPPPVAPVDPASEPPVHPAPDLLDEPALPVPAPVAAVEEIELVELGGTAESAPTGADDLSLVLDVPVEVTVVMGKAMMTIRDTLGLGTGSIITLDRLVGEPADLFANGRLIARGEVVAIDEEYGLRVTEVLATPHGAREAA